MKRQRMLQLQPWLYRLLLPDSRRSLRQRLLVILLVPLMLLLVINSLITYTGALIYSNRVHDDSLCSDALTLMQMLATQDPDGRISPQARFLLEYDPGGHNYYSYFSVRSARHGLLAGNGDLQPRLPLAGQAEDGHPHLYDARIGKRRLRAASVIMPNARDPEDTLTVTVAETLRDRHLVARQILLLSIPAQAVLILAVFLLVWFGVRTGLRQLDPLAERLAHRGHDLSPIGEAGVPVEILPLTRTIDELFARLRSMLALQDRFIADAAHQLRTPLAGLRVHAERAQAHPDPATLDESLRHIRQLIERANRTSTQLLVLTRAQSAQRDDKAHAMLDLATLVPDLVRQRVHEALMAGIDLGYDGPDEALWIEGDRHTLQELLDNLVDNGLRYAGRGASMTIALAREEATICLSVADDGPGVPAQWLPRLGERFFRVPGSGAEGTGLGLAIVQRIAEHHAAQVRYCPGSTRGFLVEVRFPAITKKSGDSGNP